MDVRLGDFVATQPMRDNVTSVLDSGRLSPGPFVAELEREFSLYHRVKHGIMTNSGTSALVVALQALKEIEEWPDGAEVIVPAITFVATVNAVLHCNLKPVLVDIDPAYYTMDVSLIPDAMTQRTKAIVPVHAFGLPADMSVIMKIASDYNLKIVEDACEALGATYGGQPVGSIGVIGCLSFYMSHHIASGVGGLAVTGNPWYANKMRSLANHGWDRKIAPMDATEFDFEAIRQRYWFTSVGHSFRATEFQAAIALPQLEGLRANIQQRVNNAKILTSGLKPFADKLQLPICPYNRSHALMMYPIVLLKGDKQELIRHLETNGIETRDMLPITNQPCYEGLFNEEDYPIAQWINEQGFYIGCSQYLNDSHMDYVIRIVEEYFG